MNQDKPPHRMYLSLIGYIRNAVDGNLTTIRGAEILERKEIKDDCIEALAILEQVVRSTNNRILIDAYERAVESHGQEKPLNAG